MVPQGGPDPNDVGGHHVEVKVLDEVQVGLDQDHLPQHGVLQHHGVQGHHGGQHVPLRRGPRQKDHASTSRGLFEVQEA